MITPAPIVPLEAAAATPRKSDGPEVGEQQEERDEEAEIADPVDDERLLPRFDREVLVVVEADQQVGAEADAFPPEEDEEVAAPEHQDQHHREEEVQVGEVAGVPLLVPHVAHRVEVDERADPGHDQGHDDREGIELEGEVGADAAGGEPAVDHVDVRLAVGGDRRVLDRRGGRQDGGQEGGADADDADEAFAGALSEKAVQQKPDEGDQRDENQVVEHADCGGAAAGGPPTSPRVTSSLPADARRIVPRVCLLVFVAIPLLPVFGGSGIELVAVTSASDSRRRHRSIPDAGRAR